MKQVLVVCTANICRSPMGEGLIRHRLHQEGLTEWRVASAGIQATPGLAASESSVLEMRDRGIDISSHSAQATTLGLLKMSDLILVMTHVHHAYVRNQAPRIAHRVRMFSELIGSPYDVADPYRMPRHAYAACAQELEYFVENGWQRLIDWTVTRGTQPLPRVSPSLIWRKSRQRGNKPNATNQ